LLALFAALLLRFGLEGLSLCSQIAVAAILARKE
jgi:hypothetical protein